MQCLEHEGIPVVSAGSVAELEGWPIGKVLVTHAAAVTRLWFDMGAAHVVVLADSDEERALASGIGHERTTVANGAARQPPHHREIEGRRATRQPHGGPAYRAR